MGQLLLAVLTGVLIAAGGQQLAKGGIRWRRLTIARHELETAKLLDNHDLAGRLRSRAHGRIEKYLAEFPRQRWMNVVYGVVFLISGASGAIGILALGGAEALWIPPVATVLGIVANVLWIRWETRHAERLEQQLTTPPPPQQPQPDQSQDQAPTAPGTSPGTSPDPQG